MTLAETLAFLLPPNAELRFGELYLTRDKGGVFAVRHRDDRKSEDGLRWNGNQATLPKDLGCFVRICQ